MPIDTHGCGHRDLQANESLQLSGARSILVRRAISCSTDRG
jgi:hypothetical protein